MLRTCPPLVHTRRPRAHILTASTTTIHEKSNDTGSCPLPDSSLIPSNPSTEQSDQIAWASHERKRETTVALGRGALGTRRPLDALWSRFLGLGQRAFEFLQGEAELVGMKLLGLLPEHRPAQLAKQVFETPVLLFQMTVARLQIAGAVFEAAVALGERRELGVKRLERGPVGGFEGRGIELGNGHIHDRNTIIESAC